MKCTTDEQGQDIRTYISGSKRILRKPFDTCERIEKHKYQMALKRYYEKNDPEYAKKMVSGKFDKTTEMIVKAKKINDGKTINLRVKMDGVIGDIIDKYNEQTGVKKEHIALFF